MTDWSPGSQEIAARLHLRLSAENPTWRVWHEVQMPVAHAPPGRCDVWAFRVSWSRFCIRIYEVKASRGDLLRDLESGKYRLYLPHCNELWFATAPGLSKGIPIPDDCGLVELRPPGSDYKRQIHVVKRAPHHEWSRNVHQLLALLMSHDTCVDRRSGFPMPRRVEDASYGRDQEWRHRFHAEHELGEKHRRRNAGHDAATAVSAARAIEQRAARWKPAAEFAEIVARDLGVPVWGDGWIEKARAAWSQRAGGLTPAARGRLVLWLREIGLEVKDAP